MDTETRGGEVTKSPLTDAKAVRFEMGVPVLNCTEVVDAEWARELEEKLAAAQEEIDLMNTMHNSECDRSAGLKAKLAAAQKDVFYSVELTAALALSKRLEARLATTAKRFKQLSELNKPGSMQDVVMAVVEENESLTQRVMDKSTDLALCKHELAAAQKALKGVPEPTPVLFAAWHWRAWYADHIKAIDAAKGKR